jgi:hypothetical protein
MRSATSSLGALLRRSLSSAGTRTFAAEAAPAVSSDIGYVAQVNAEQLLGAVGDRGWMQAYLAGRSGSNTSSSQTGGSQGSAFLQ